MAQARVVLAGGGDAEDSRPLIRQFASWVGEPATVLYLPVAKAGSGRSYETSLNWLRTTLGPLGLGSVEMWTDLAGKTAADLDRYGALYIGGGNTFRLMQQLRANGLDAALTEYVAGGRPVYSCGSGAIALGKEIQTCAHKEANTVHLEDMRGLDVLQGYSVWCHYAPIDDTRIAAYCAKSGTPVLALGERGGAVLEEGVLSAAGYDGAVRFAKARSSTIAPGAAIA